MTDFYSQNRCVCSTRSHGPLLCAFCLSFHFKFSALVSMQNFLPRIIYAVAGPPRPTLPPILTPSSMCRWVGVEMLNSARVKRARSPNDSVNLTTTKTKTRREMSAEF